MMKKILLALFLIPTLTFAQHTISGNFTPADQFTWCILYKVNSDNYKYVTDGKVVDGKFSLSLDPSVEKGAYKLVYGVPQGEKNFDILYNAKEDIELSFSETEGVTFIVSEENKAFKEYKLTLFQLDQDIAKAYASESLDQAEITELFRQKAELQKNAEDLFKGEFSEDFVIASRSYIPKGFEPYESYMENRRLGYFNDVDPNNPVLQNSSFLIDTFLEYINRFSLETEAASFRELDAIIDLVKGSDPVFQKDLLSQLWGALVIEDKPKSANYLTKKYLLELCETLGEKEIAKKLKEYKNTSVGELAPDFSWDVDNNGTVELRSLHTFDVAENYILVFWSSTCSHCLRELPKLQKLAQSLNPKEYKVIAVGIEDGKYDWKNEVLRYPEFEHVLALGKWESEIAKAYSISHTPTFFLLDKDKVLTAKPHDLPELIEIVAPEKKAEK